MDKHTGERTYQPQMSASLAALSGSSLLRPIEQITDFRQIPKAYFDVAVELEKTTHTEVLLVRSVERFTSKRRWVPRELVLFATMGQPLRMLLMSGPTKVHRSVFCCHISAINLREEDGIISFFVDGDDCLILRSSSKQVSLSQDHKAPKPPIFDVASIFRQAFPQSIKFRLFTDSGAPIDTNAIYDAAIGAITTINQLPTGGSSTSAACRNDEASTPPIAEQRRHHSMPPRLVVAAAPSSRGTSSLEGKQLIVEDETAHRSASFSGTPPKGILVSTACSLRQPNSARRRVQIKEPHNTTRGEDARCSRAATDERAAKEDNDDDNNFAVVEFQRQECAAREALEATNDEECSRLSNELRKQLRLSVVNQIEREIEEQLSTSREEKEESAQGCRDVAEPDVEPEEFDLTPNNNTAATVCPMSEAAAEEEEQQQVYKVEDGEREAAVQEQRCDAQEVEEVKPCETSEHSQSPNKEGRDVVDENPVQSSSCNLDADAGDADTDTAEQQARPSVSALPPALRLLEEVSDYRCIPTQFRSFEDIARSADNSTLVLLRSVHRWTTKCKWVSRLVMLMRLRSSSSSQAAPPRLMVCHGEVVVRALCVSQIQRINVRGDGVLIIGVKGGEDNLIVRSGSASRGGETLPIGDLVTVILKEYPTYRFGVTRDDSEELSVRRANVEADGNHALGGDSSPSADSAADSDASPIHCQEAGEKSPQEENSSFVDVRDEINAALEAAATELGTVSLRDEVTSLRRELLAAVEAKERESKLRRDAEAKYEALREEFEALKGGEQKKDELNAPKREENA